MPFEGPSESFETQTVFEMLHHLRQPASQIQVTASEILISTVFGDDQIYAYDKNLVLAWLAETDHNQFNRLLSAHGLQEALQLVSLKTKPERSARLTLVDGDKRLRGGTSSANLVVLSTNHAVDNLVGHSESISAESKLAQAKLEVCIANIRRLDLEQNTVKHGINFTDADSHVEVFTYDEIRSTLGFIGLSDKEVFGRLKMAQEDSEYRTDLLIFLDEHTAAA